MPSSHMLTATITLMPIRMRTCRKYASCTNTGKAINTTIRTMTANLDVITEQPAGTDDQDQHQDREVDDERQLTAEQRARSTVRQANEQSRDHRTGDAAHAAALND